MNRAARRAAHFAAEEARWTSAGHPHASPSRACVLCARDAVQAHEDALSAYRDALETWRPYRPMRPLDYVRGGFEFAAILIFGPLLVLGWYAHLFAGFATVRFVAGVGLDAAVQWLLGAGLLVGLVSFAASDDRSIPRPVYPPMDDFTYTAYDALRVPRVPAEDIGAHMNRIRRMWPDSAPAGAAPIIEPEPQRHRRPPPRVREVIESWHLTGQDDLPF